MAVLSPKEIAQLAVETGEKKAKSGAGSTLILGFLGGVFIAFGFLLDIRVTGTLPKAWGSISGLVGGSVFALGLILVLLAGAELLTGNFLTVAIATFAGRVTVGQLLRNWILVLIGNFVGAVFVAYSFGHIVGLTEGDFLKATTTIAHAKYSADFGAAFVSAVGCNWLVCLAVWLNFGAQDMGGKILAIWFPVMAFVATGFQHVIANMFVIPAAIFAGAANWGDWFHNFIPVLLGNLVGGAVFVAFLYYVVYLRNPQAEENFVASKAGQVQF